MSNENTNATLPIIICAGRLVYYGKVPEDQDLTATTMKIYGARNCIRWSRTIGGVGGLAATGPNEHCLIGASVPWQIVHNISVVRGCSPEAEKAWEEAPSCK